MKSYWTQPSLSRDFTLLSLAVFFILFMVSMLVTFATYSRHSELIGAELEKEATRIEQTLAGEITNANYLLTSIGRQIIVNNARDLEELARILKSFDSKDQIYTVFNWINVDQKVLVSSNRGVLEKPVDISDRDFVRKSFAEPWKMQIGRPIEGRISGRWVVPVVMGLTDYTGKFVGTLLISIDISLLTEKITKLVKREGISFAIISKTLIPLTQVSDDKNFIANNFPSETLVDIDFEKNPRALISQGSPLWRTGNFNYYVVSKDFPYIILMGYDNHYQDNSVRNLLWARLLQMVVLAAFFIMFLLLVRNRMIKPVIEITNSVSSVARGKFDGENLPTGGPIEIHALASQVKRVGEYITENKRVEHELRSKMLALKRKEDTMEIEKQSRAEFLTYICQEMRTPLSNTLGYVQIMKDQLYGAIENKKYRQYIIDIYTQCNQTIHLLNDVLLLAKTDSQYYALKEVLVDLPTTINKAIRALSDKLETQQISIKLEIQDHTLQLYADEFRIQQMISNLLLHYINAGISDTTLHIITKSLVENNDRQKFAIIITDDIALPDSSELLKLSNTQRPTESQCIHLNLAKRLAELHQATLHEASADRNKNLCIILFPNTRIRFLES